ncbi:glycosyltransferase family 2 protein [Aeromonas veronii]|uniref:glycosyltransferase family 2 protein n=1 Tax=Aeromonas veronii TaxID=654 RepID=UPI003D21BB4B
MLSIGAIFKNEYPFILEWLAYHQCLGINNFYIADNISTDGSSELLAALDTIGLIKRISYPTQPNTPPQLGAYREVLKHAKQDEWIAFIDADEFFSPQDYEDGLTSIKPLLENPEIGAISINWAVYGSSYSILPNNGLVIERFTHRAPEHHAVNKHYKSLVRVSAVVDTGVTPHSFTIRHDQRFVMVNGINQDKKDGIGEQAVWSPLRLNHYVIKSKAEFLNKKASRGRATTLKDSMARDISFFRGHDLNHNEDHVPQWFIDKVKLKISEIINKLDHINYKYSVEQPNIPVYKTKKGMGVGFADALSKKENIYELRGWVIDVHKAPVHRLLVILNNIYPVSPEEYIVVARNDVHGKGISSELNVGFRASFRIPDINIHAFNVYGLDENGLVCAELGVNSILSDIFC